MAADGQMMVSGQVMVDVVITIFQHVRVSGKYPKMAECSWTTAHRRPWRFCCFVVSLHWFLQHFVLFSPCLWSVFQVFFLLFFFVQQPLAEPSLQEDTWSGFFTPSTKVFFSSQGSLNCWVKNKICYSQRNSSLTYQVADNRFRRGNVAWRSAAKSLNLPFESVCHQQKVFVKPGKKVDIGTQVIDRTWLEMKTWLGRKYPVSIRKNTESKTQHSTN